MTAPVQVKVPKIWGKCPRCGTVLLTDEFFCPACGAQREYADYIP